MDLPHLGIGVSTEYGAGESPSALDILGLREHAPQFAQFLEVGIEVVKGLDWHTRAWLERGLPTTYHFLDINLDDPRDMDEPWLAEVRALADRVRPAWLCGDAGLWHFGMRDRGHMLLLPPILSDANAAAMADGVARLREETGLEVLPENPPATVYVGNLHLLDYFAQVCDRADTGMLLDAAHLAIYQRLQGHDPLTGLDRFPLDRVLEIHVAGGIERDHGGFAYIEDSHTPQVLPDTWRILEYVVARAPHLKAVVFECERNPIAACLPAFGEIERVLHRHAAAPAFRT
ncbi:MAG: DUF692 family protein [Candidatus Eisenbacteria bacterium]|uniref:DUF692 family protein n=1 Tax=Eiseniibacteriota bacterium TaxID=2212470 RepID=A0A956RPT0_UNCEI|nr:DUF692 family protein [Candidatus Eisenbacteria bacterium]